MTIVETRSGKVRGVEQDGIHVFRGLPFAAPPVGDLRWRPPVREEPWDDVRDCVAFGPYAAQGPSPLEAAMGAGEPRKSEDCLYLNVWTPGVDDAHRPVMVWIHGGGFLTGSGAIPWYDGTRFARNGDVVLVTLNYRLAAFGFWYLDELFGDELAGSGNLGILDQVAALRWVRDDVAAFGGDPENVTIFGESAGGGSVGTLLGTPGARGLFHGAIPQSGAASWVHRPPAATAVARTVLDALGVAPGDLDALRACTTEQVVRAQTAGGGEMAAMTSGSEDAEASAAALPFQPVVDGVVLPEPPLDAIRGGSSAGVRVLVGTNAHEMTLFGLLEPRLADIDDAGLEHLASRFLGRDAPEVIASYRAARPDASAHELWIAIATDAAFRIPAIRLAEAHLPHGPVWKYLFTWATPALGGGLGSTHALEIPFVFDNLHQPGATLFTGDGEERQGIADAMHAAWIAFAREGDPAHAGLPAWPRYDDADRATMVFDVEFALQHDPQGRERVVWHGRA